MINAVAIALTESDFPRFTFRGAVADAVVRTPVLGVFAYARMVRLIQGGVPASFVPLLEGCLSSTDPSIRCGGAVELGNIGSAARSALPALEKSLEAEIDPVTRDQIRFAISSIRAGL